MDRAYEGDNMRATAKELGYTPVVPPKKNRIDPWEYDEELYKRRNEVERFFRRIKRFRRVFTRYDKLDIVFAGFILFAMIVDALVYTDSNILQSDSRDSLRWRCCPCLSAESGSLLP